jgi:L-lactate dehydrogenase complex protein LldG
MSMSSVIKNVATALGRRPGDKISQRPILPTEYEWRDKEEALKLFREEVEKLSGEVQQIMPDGLEKALVDLIQRHAIKRAAIWSDAKTNQYQLKEKLTRLGIEVVPGGADKNALALCDLGITTVDYAIPNTGTIGLLASPEKPKAVSLLPRVHLAIMTSADLRPNLTAVLKEVKGSCYLTLISGPSRTSDIELILTLGVHGPKNLVVWII